MFLLPSSRALFTASPSFSSFASEGKLGMPGGARMFPSNFSKDRLLHILRCSSSNLSNLHVFSMLIDTCTALFASQLPEASGSAHIPPCDR